MNNLCHVYDMGVARGWGGAWEREAHTCEGGEGVDKLKGGGEERGSRSKHWGERGKAHKDPMRNEWGEYTRGVWGRDKEEAKG